MKYSLFNTCRKYLKVVLCAVSLFAGTSFVHAQVTVEATIDSLQLLIGEQAKIKLQVSMDANQKLRLPLFSDTIVRGVEIVDVAKPDTQLLNDNKRWLISQEYTVTSFDSALYYLPPMKVMVNDKQYQSEALALKVYSIPVDTLHPDQFFGPKEIRKVPLIWSDVIFSDVASLVYSSVLMLILGGVAVFLVMSYVTINKVKPKLPPHQIAFEKIEEIKSNQSWRQNDPKMYYTELTDAIRAYIKDRFGFNALEMTSSEIIEHLLQEKDKDSIKDLCYLFEVADLVKFAKYAPLMNENDMNLLNAVDFINQTKIEEDPNAKKRTIEVKVGENRSKKERIALICCIVVDGIGALIALYVVISFFF